MKTTKPERRSQFELNGQEYIELNKLLKLLQLTETGGEANEAISRGKVRVNQLVATEKRKKLRAGDRVNFRGVSITIKA